MRLRDLLYPLCLAVVLSGCAAAPLSASFQPDGAIVSAPKAKLLVVVEPEENRPGEGTSSLGKGFLVFLPLVPYGEQRFTPERYWKNATTTVYDFRRDLGQTVVKDLRAAGIAATVTYVDANPARTISADGNTAVLELRLNESWWHRYFTTYGLSIGGVYLWLVGAPASYGHVTLAMEAALKDASGKQLAQESFVGEASLTEWVYVMHAFPRRLPVAYGQISPALRRFVLENLPK